MTGGYAVGGTMGAITAASIGQAARIAAQKVTAGKERYVRSLTTAGKNGRNIVKAYIANTPKNKRNPRELGELLLDPDIDLAKVGDDGLAGAAANIAGERRAQLIAAVATTEGMENPPAEQEGK